MRLHPYLTGGCSHQDPRAGRPRPHWSATTTSGWTGRATRTASGARPCRLLDRLLAAAESYQARPSRAPTAPPLDADRGRRPAPGRVRAGRLDADAAEAVLPRPGTETRPSGPRPAGLTPREVEVLRLVAGGLSNREIAAALVHQPRRPHATTWSAPTPSSGSATGSGPAATRSSTAWSADRRGRGGRGLGARGCPRTFVRLRPVATIAHRAGAPGAALTGTPVRVAVTLVGAGTGIGRHGPGRRRAPPCGGCSPPDGAAAGRPGCGDRDRRDVRAP